MRGFTKSIRIVAGLLTGLLFGPHLLLATSSGKVDASLGRFALRGKTPLSVAPGKEVQVTGVMKMIKDKEVFVARVVKVDGKAYKLRNQHGVPVSPLSRERAAQKGESL